MKLNIIVILLIANVFVWQNLYLPGTTEVDFLDVGQGDAILIQHGRTQVLIDSGSNGDVVHELSRVMPSGDKKIEAVMMTHPDLDHYGGFAEVFKRFEVENFISTGQRTSSSQFAEFEEVLKAENSGVYNVAGGQLIAVDEIKLSVLYPFSLKPSDDNANSLVMKLDLGGKTFLLTGDIERSGERVLANVYKDALKSDILKVAHHGSKTSTSLTLLEMLSPEYSVIQVGKNSYGHPTEAVLERLKNTRILRNDRDGTIRFVFRGDELEIIESN